MIRRSGVADQAADPQDAAVYEAAEVGRWVGLKPSQVRRWVGRKTSRASFLDLIDLLFAKPFLDRGLRLRHLHAALGEAEKLLGADHFASREFFTDGHGLFLRAHTYGEALLSLLSDGEWVAADGVLQVAERIDFDAASGRAERWYPAGIDGLIVIDPYVACGRPTIDGRGVATGEVYASFVAERRSVTPVCARFALDAREVEAAVAFEERRGPG